MINEEQISIRKWSLNQAIRMYYPQTYYDPRILGKSPDKRDPKLLMKLADEIYQWVICHEMEPTSK